jgi:Ca2+-binding RTX toxin-like protein
MVALRPREPRPASPDPYQSDRARDRERRRVVSQPHASPGRPARVNLDSLAIGAPLTAALVGVLLTEGEGALGNAAAGASAGGDAAVRNGDGEVGTPWHHDVARARLGPAAQGALAGQAAASTSGEIFDPVAASQAVAPTDMTAGTAAGGLVPPGAIPAGMDGEAALSAGTSITLGTGTPLDGFALDGGSAEGASSAGRIGATITGTAGDDVIHGTPHDDRLFGGAGNDIIHGHEGDDLLDGGAGDDQLLGGPGNDALLGGTGQDQLLGGSGDDRLLGGSDDDRLLGEEGRDWLDGGAGDDVLDGGPDPDRLIGGAGDDMLTVGNIHDVAFGDGSGVAVAGTDTLVVQAAFATHLLEQMGEQRATFAFSENFGQSLPSGVAGYHQQVAGDIQNITLQGTADHDVVGDSRANVLRGNDGDNKLYGGAGDDVLHGGGGNDVLQGGAGDDVLHGDSGNEQLLGGSGNDSLYGGAGDDLLNGGAGDDLLYGGAGNDNFVIGLNDSGVDTVFDYEGSNRLTIQGGAGHLVQTALAGDQLYVVVDDAVVAIMDGYRGNEDAFVGIDTGAGLRTIDQLMASGAEQGPALDGPATAAASIVQTDDLLGDYLSQPSLHGTAGDDDLVGTSGADWLVGGAGKDHLIGGAANDILEGGPGNNLLEGGGGDDRYLFKAGDGGLSTIIRDSEGANVAELDGFASAKLQGALLGKNLVVVANHAPVFTFEDFVGNEQAFAGVQIGDQFVATEDLLH